MKRGKETMRTYAPSVASHSSHQDDQEPLALDELRSVVREFLTKHASESEVRRLAATDLGYDPAVWEQMATQLDLLGLALPEEAGGSGFGYRTAGVVMEEAGRALLCAPHLSSVVLAGEVLLSAQLPQDAASLLSAIVSGSTTAAVAWADETAFGSVAERDVAPCSAQQDGAGWSVDGVKSFVVDGHSAALLLVLAEAPEGPTLFAVDGTDPGLTRTRMKAVDLTRPQAHVTFEGCRGRPVCAPGEGRQALDPALERAAVLLAAEQLGVASKALEMSVTHLCARTQFGRPLGSFQGLKHQCADLFVEIEAARSAVQHALDCLDRDDGVPQASALALAQCSETAVRTTRQNIHLHGGMGFTWEHPAHLYYRRALGNQALLGPPASPRERYAELLLGEG